MRESRQKIFTAARVTMARAGHLEIENGAVDRRTDRLDSHIQHVINMDAWEASAQKQQREICAWLRKHPGE